MTPEEEREWLWELKHGGVRPETWEFIAGIVAQRDAERARARVLDAALTSVGRVLDAELKRNAKVKTVAHMAQLVSQNAREYESSDGTVVDVPRLYIERLNLALAALEETP